MASIPKIFKPICLIENSGGNPSVNEEAKKVLENITQPLVVVSIVGPYRSGKSYLLNKLSGDSEGGFSLGHTLSANTKGIWMRCIPHPKKSDHTLILLDTEGVGDVEKGNLQNDRMILSLAMLMSSVVIYNSKANIDQDAVKKLHSMTETHRFISEKASKQNGQDVQTGNDDHMSSLLVWAVRDFALKLQINGRPVTADEYLENSLQDITPVKTLRTQEQNKVRKTIRKCFPKRKCFVFDFPSSDMSTLDQLSDTRLQPRFVEKTKEFCQFVLHEVPPKRLKGGMAVTGTRFAHLLQPYLDVVKRQDIAFLESSLSDMFITENRKMINKCIEVYEAKMSSQNVKSHEEFQQIHKAAEEEAKQELKKLYVKHEKSQEEYQTELKTSLPKKKEEIWKMCEESSLQRCNAIMEQLKSKLHQNIKDNKYNIHGGLKTFKNDKKLIIEEYKQRQDKGVKAEDVLQDFLRSLEPIEKVISKVEKEDIVAPKPKILKPPNRDDPTQLTQYIQNYQLPQGPFNRILIQLFGFAGHGKSSFVNSCLYAVNSGRFNDYAGEASEEASHGGKTMDRRGYQLTNNITIVDNRGFSKLNSSEEWEIYAQLCNCVPLNEMVSWNKSLRERVQLVTKRVLEETSDVIVPVLIYSSEQILNEENENIRGFLKQAQILTRILPFIVLTKNKTVKESTLKDKFLRMGMENIYCIENYLCADHLALRGKHHNILTVLYDILEAVNFHMMNKSNYQNQRVEWMSFLMEKAGTMQ